MKMAEITAKESNNPRWVSCDLAQVFDSRALGRLLEDITSQNEVRFIDEKSALKTFDFPDFSSNRLSTAALVHIAQGLSQNIARAVSSVSETPAVMLMKRQSLVWRRVVSACEQHVYSESNLKRALSALQGQEGEGELGDDVKKQPDVSEQVDSPEKRTGNDILVELGIKTGLTVVFSLLKQSWAQLSWQRLIEQQLSMRSALCSPGLPQPSLPNEVLRSVLVVLKGIPPLSLSNMKSLNKLSACCLEQSTEFLYSIVQADSFVDQEGKRLACEIMLSLVLQQGTLNTVLVWVEKMLSCLAGYAGRDEARSKSCVLSMEACLEAVEEIRRRTRLHGASIQGNSRPFAPKDRTPEGHALVSDFVVHLCDELSRISADCTRCFSEDMGAESIEKPFLSDTCDVYAFGSNSSSQLAMGSTEKFVKATLMPHMANCQLVEAGQYCTFVVFSDGVMKGCGKGSYGRLGLGTSDSEPALKVINTFPPEVIVRRVASSRGSDGHSLAITGKGQVYSWGDGNYGKLGHGDHITQKVPKLVEALSGKVVRQVACGNRHSAAITADGELYTWGEGDYGRLGHGSTASVKVPTKVTTIDLAQQVACGAAHTLVLSMDGLTVWSFGSGDLGKLGHGDANRQIIPKVIEGLRGMVCQKVCAGSQFSVVLTAAGKVYSFGNGSGVGKGTTEPRQYTPWLIESLEGEVIIDVATGDGHCLALTQRGEVYAWGTNSMGQCGQGHSNGSITVPSKVVGLEGVQIQQISAGTSHSLAWTAVPLDRRASALWHWPYCVSVGEGTYGLLLSILNKYGGLSSPYPVAPFYSKQTQESFIYSMMSLLRTHLKLSAPLGPLCVHMACGSQVKHIRSYLFKLIDTELPPAIDQVTTEALVVGAPILVPPVLERLELLLGILPKEPGDFSILTSGQRRQIDLLLVGLDDGSEVAGLIVDEEWTDCEGEAATYWVCTKHVGKLFALCELAAEYIFEATMHALDKDTTSPLPEPVQLGSHLIRRFERLVTSVYCNVLTFMTMYLGWGERSDQLLLPFSDRKGVLIHFEPFFHILRDLSLHVLLFLAKNSHKSSDSLAYLRAQRDVQFGFLAYQFPSHVALTTNIVPAFDIIFNVGELLLEVADAVHQLVLLLPPDLVQECEKRELQWEPVYLKPEKLHTSLLKLREGEEELNQWQRWMDYERLLCWSASQCVHFLYCSELVDSKETEVLQYSVGKDKPTLFSSGLLKNGAISGITHALYNWVSLCKTIYQPDDSEECEGLSDCWTDYIDEYKRLKDRTPVVHNAQLDLFLDPHMIGPCDPSITIPLFALAVGATGNHQAEGVYERMMEFAKRRDWNTWSDEGSLPQLRQTSCAALACCLHHSGLLTYAMTCKSSPKKQMVSVYRAVFALRREVFIHRPLMNSEGRVDPIEQKRFEEVCRGICFTLFFMTCVLSPAFPEESSSEESHIAADILGDSSSDLRHPGPGSHNKPSDGGPEDETNSDPLSASSSSELFDWSQPSVKQAWSLLSMRWQKDRGDAHHTSSSPSGQDQTKKVIWSIVDVVCQIFKTDATMLNRENLVHALVTHHRRATDRRDALKKVALFLEKVHSHNALLPSSKLTYLSSCLSHSIHYSQNISVASGELQNEIETLYHFILREIVSRVYKVELSDIKGLSCLELVRELLLVLQWTNFQHNPSDIQLLFDGDFLSKVVAFSGVVTPTPCGVPVAADSRLCGALQQGCEQLLKLLALRVGSMSDLPRPPFDGSLSKRTTTHLWCHIAEQASMGYLHFLPSVGLHTSPTRELINASDLKTHPGILNKVSAVLYGQLEGYICHSNPRISEQWHAKGIGTEQRETELGEFLCFLSILLAPGGYLHAVMAMEGLSSMLLKVVGVGPCLDQSVVSSLKTRLLALQVMETAVCEPGEEGFGDLSKCVEIVESLFELMYKSAVDRPVLPYQEGLSQLQRSGAEDDCEIPCATDPSWQHNCSVTMEGRTALVIQESGPGYAIGLLPFTNGRYTWKVSTETTKPAFFVGLALKRLTPKGIQSSNDVWVLDAASGRLYHGGEQGETLFVMSDGGDTFTVEFDSVAKTLSFGKNSEPLKVAFNEISKPGEELFPALFFNKKSGTTRVRLHPILKQTKTFVSSIRRREQLVSGFPLLSNTGVTLTQSVINLLYKLQEKQPWAEAVGLVLRRRLEELTHTNERFSNFKTQYSSRTGADPQCLASLGNILGQALKTLWPCLVVIGGMDTGLYIGRECQVTREDVEGPVTVVSVPNAQQEVMVQEQVTNRDLQATKRRVAVADLRLTNQRKFLLSLVTPWLSPSMLMDIANLSGILGNSNHISAIISSAQRPPLNSSLQITSSPDYLQLCLSILQVSATECLYALLFDEAIIPLLLDHTPSQTLLDRTSPHHPTSTQHETGVHHLTASQPAGSHKAPGSQQGSMNSVLRTIVGHLAQCSVQPSPLKPALGMAELDRLHSVLVCETLGHVAEDLWQRNRAPCGDSVLPEVPKTITPMPVLPPLSAPAPVSASPLPQSLPDAPDRESGEPSSSNSPPPVLDVLVDMGFPAAHIRIALDRCGLPEGASLQAQMEMLVCWIIDHRNLLGMMEEVLGQSEGPDEEDAGPAESGEELARGQTGEEENTLITELLENEVDGTVSNQTVKHAPDLLEGPSLDSNGFDVSIADLGTLPQSSFQSALDQLQKSPIPVCLEFPSSDPLGESLCQAQRTTMESRKEDGSDSGQATSPLCSRTVAQAQDLCSPDECLVALHRVTTALQSLVARHVSMLVLCAISTYPLKEFLASLGMLKLDNPSFLIGLLRLVHAGRIVGASGGQFSIKLRSSLLPVLGIDCLCAAIKAISSLESTTAFAGPQSTVMSPQTSGSHRFVQACCQDLVAAAVGGAEMLMMRGQCGKSLSKTVDVTDVSILSCPNFSVSQSLVQGMIDAATTTCLGSGEVVCLTDALAACVISSKLQCEHRLWALKQMLRLLSTAEKEEDVDKEVAIMPSSLEHLIGHKGQIMACVENDKAQRLISIAEDNDVVLWNMAAGLKHPDMTVLSLSPDVSAGGGGYLLPILAQNSSQVCVAVALNQTLCVWRVKDGQVASLRLPELITALEWKKCQKEGDSPMLLVGLVSGQLLLAAVLRTSVNLTPEIHPTYLEQTFKGAVCSVSWSPSGHHFMVASTCGLHVYSHPSTLGSTCALICREARHRAVARVDWSLVDTIAASVERNSCTLEIWDISQSQLVSVYRSTDLRITQSAWHSTASEDGTMLLGGGSRSGTIYLWTVRQVNRTPNLGTGGSAVDVHLVATLSGHSAPITSLTFSVSGALLASGCQAGSVRVWDIRTNQLLKLATRTVGEVLSLCWTYLGLAICYKNTNTLCLLPPGPQDYLGEHSIHYACHALRRYGIYYLGKAPCLTALLKSALLILADQHRYEVAEIASGSQVTHSEYLQSLMALVMGLDLHHAVVLPLHPLHLPPAAVPVEWQWLDKLNMATTMAHCLTKRTPFPNLYFPQQINPADPYQPTDNSAWTLKMDAQIVEWLAERPQDWWQVEAASVHTWGRGTAHQLGHSTMECTLPDHASQWEEDMRLIVAGNLCTYGIKFDGSLWSVGEGLHGRLGHGGTIGETSMRLIGALQGISVVHVVAGPRVSAPIDEGFALALTSGGEVYSWGRGFGGHLGHSTTEDLCTPRLVESLVGKDIKMIAACDRHCAAVTTSGHLYTFGLADHGQLGQGHTLTNQLDGPVVRVTCFLDSDERTQLNDVRVGYVCCGQSHTIAISESGSEVFGFGSSECGSFGLPMTSGDHHHPYLLSHLAPFGPFVKGAAGRHVTALINVRGQACWFGKLCEGMAEQAPEFLQLPGEKVIDVQIAYSYMLLLTEMGNLYSMGKSAPGTCLLGYEATMLQTTPKLIERLSGKHVKQISAGPSHASASNVPHPQTQREAATCLIPLSVPAQYSSLRDIPCQALHARFLVLNQFSQLILSSWRLFSSSMCDATSIHINPLAEASTRLLICPTASRSMLDAVVNRTMSSKTHGPTITVNRTVQDSRSRPVFPQIATQIVQKPPSDLRCSSRAWKVTLIGEAADDAGGVFDETIALMCEELQSNTLDLLIPTPNARNKCGFNMDRYVLNPRCTSPRMMRHLKFLGIMLGVAIRTKKPLALHLAQPMWKLLAGMTLTTEDLEEMDLMFIRTMYSIQGVHTTGIREDEFSELIPIEFFEAEDMNGHFVPIVPGGGHIKLTFHNRKEYVEKAIHFRLHELDQQVAAVREGMASIVPVPLLSLYTARMLEITVCGSEQVDIQVLKKVARYRDGISEGDEIIRWLWQTLDSFTNEEKVLFLRFVSGRSRLPARVSEITQRFKILKGGETSDALPTAQTCFFQIRLPVYRSQQVMADRLRYAIRNCRSIDMDNYMLRRTPGEWENDEEL